MYMMKQIEKNQRPRERLIAHGPKALSDIELIAILLQTGTKELSVLDLSVNVLKSIQKLQNLNRISVAELTLIKGIKEAKATTIIAAIELGRRLENQYVEKYHIVDHLDVYNLMNPVMKHLTQEHFYVIFLNTKSVVIDKKCIFIGSLNQTVIHPREIFNEAIKLMAYAIILVHNHPSGDPTPSKSDYDVTDILIEASDIIGIQIAEHLVIGHEAYYSIKLKRRYQVKKK